MISGPILPTVPRVEVRNTGRSAFVRAPLASRPSAPTCAACWICRHSRHLIGGGAALLYTSVPVNGSLTLSRQDRAKRTWSAQHLWHVLALDLTYSRAYAPPHEEGDVM